jgi:hypothetical protein
LEAKRFSRDFFFIAFLNSPCYDTPKNAIKKIEQNNRGFKKKNGGKKAAFFCDEPRWIFSEIFFFRVFELPLLRNAQKTPFKKIDKK